MTDLFATRFDLMSGTTVPYTDDPDGYDPTDALFELAPVVQKGRFDFQRQGTTFNGNYTNASNFAVGDFMNGAGFSWPATVVLGDVYALTHDGLRIPPNDKPWWQSGYDAAASGQLPKGEGR